MVALQAFTSLLVGCGPRPQLRPNTCLQSTPPPRRPTPDDVTAARQWFTRGTLFVGRRRWGEALDAFRNAQRLIDHPVTSFNIALTLQRLGRHEEVIVELTHFNVVYDVVRDRPLHDAARILMESARRRTGELALQVAPSASVRIDGVERSHPGTETRRFTLDPGRHVVVVRAPEVGEVRFTVRTRPGQWQSRSVPARPAGGSR